MTRLGAGNAVKALLGRSAPVHLLEVAKASAFDGGRTVDLDLASVASFLVLLEEAHYGRAAARLNITPAALTKRIQRLEGQVGVALLVRDATGVSGPTPAGARFARRAGPLLAAARAAQAAARAEPPPLVLRLGVLGHLGEWPERRELVEVGRRVRRWYPNVRLVCRPVPFSAVHSCLLDSAVDVVWGATATAPPAVDLSPLVDCERAGVVAASHELAEASQLHAGDLIDLPLLYNPAVPVEWMAPFVLGDVRPARQARLVPIDATDCAAVFTLAARRHALTITPRLVTRPGPRLRPLRLVGLPPVSFDAARRRADQRAAVRTLLEILPRVAADTAMANTAMADTAMGLTPERSG